MIENYFIFTSCLSMLPEDMQVIDEEIDIKEEPLFPPSEEDKVGWMSSSCCFYFLIIDRI